MANKHLTLPHLVRDIMGSTTTIAEAAKTIGYTPDGMRSTFNRDPRKLKALLIGYKALAAEENNCSNAA